MPEPNLSRPILPPTNLTSLRARLRNHARDIRQVETHSRVACDTIGHRLSEYGPPGRLSTSPQRPVSAATFGRALKMPPSSCGPSSTLSTAPCVSYLDRELLAYAITLSMKPSHARICSSDTNSSGPCAWAMSPGPHTRVPMPAASKSPASVP